MLFISKNINNMCVCVYVCNMCMCVSVCIILFIKLSSEAQCVTRIVCKWRLLITGRSQKMFRWHLRRYQRYGWHANCSACSALRSCRSNRAGISRDVSPGNSSSSNFVTRPRRTSRTKSRGYTRQGLYIDACASRTINFHLPICFLSPDMQLWNFFQHILIIKQR